MKKPVLFCLTQRLSRIPFGLAVVVLASAGIVPRAMSQVVNKTTTQSFFTTLDRQAIEAKDSVGIRNLFLKIQARTIPGPMPNSILNRLVLAQEAFLNGTRPPITEEAVADAVNAMGRDLNPAIYTGTNARQVRLLRIQRLPLLPSLLGSASPRPADKIVANDMSPAGAVYLGLLLLRQKLANPAWFGDPDSQNKAWVSWRPQASTTAKKTRLIRNEPPEATNFRLMMTKGLSHTDSRESRAYHEFLDRLGVQRKETE